MPPKKRKLVKIKKGKKRSKADIAALLANKTDKDHDPPTSVSTAKQKASRTAKQTASCSDNALTALTARTATEVFCLQAPHD